jgi:hypothetical protein
MAICLSGWKGENVMKRVFLAVHSAFVATVPGARNRQTLAAFRNACGAATIALVATLLAPVGALATNTIFSYGYETAFNTPLTVAAPGLLVPSFNSNGYPCTTVDTILTPPSHGGFSSFGTDGSFTYVPNAGFSGGDSFTYTVSAPCGPDTVGSVTILVWPAPLTTLIGQSFIAPFDNVSFSITCNATGPSTGTFEAQNDSGPPYHWDEKGTFTLDSPTGPLSAFQATFTVEQFGQSNILGTVALAGPGSGSCDPTPSSGLVHLVAETSYSTTGSVVESGFASTTLDSPDQDPSLANFWQGPFTALAVSPGNTPTGAPVMVSFSSGVTVTFANVTQTGDTTVTSSSPSSPPVPNGYVTTGNYYFVSTTALFTTAVVCITDLNLPYVPTAALLHFDSSSSSWMDVTDYINYPVPHTGTTICSTPLTSLSPFVIATPPVVAVAAINQAYSTPFNTPLTVLTPGLLNGDSGTGITVTATTAPSHGTVSSVGANGSFTYTPNAVFSGFDTFTYTITDSASQTATATVTITVGAPPAPVAINHAYSTPLNTALSVDPPGLLDGDSGNAITVTATSNPSHGILFPGWASGSFVYAPNIGFSGIDTFTYTITDSALQRATATVTITVGSSPPPVAVNQAYSTPFNTPLTVAAPGLLSGDSGTGITVTSTTAPSHGTLSAIGTGGSFTYTPATGFSGNDTFTYTITDSASRTATATVTLAVGIPPFIIPAGDTATFTNPQFGACNNLSWGYQLNGVTNVVLFTKPLSCAPGPDQNAGPNVTIGPFPTPMTLLVFLTDITCSITYYSDGTPVDHVVVSGSNPYLLRFADAGGFCERKFVTQNDFSGFNFQVNLTIADQAITATGTNISTTEGHVFSGPVATFTDPTTFATSGEYTATIDWGDGSSSPADGQPVTISGPIGGLFTVSGSHTYREEGPYTVRVHITDTDSTNAADVTSTATVLDAVLTASPACLANSLPTYNGPTATFTDAAGPSFGTLDDFSATINWGDGKITAGTVTGNNGGPYTVSGLHTYATTGYFTITTSIKDVGGATAMVSCKVLSFTFAPGGGSFVIGDNQNSAIGNSVTFWDSSWLQDNSLSGGAHSFKGFAQNPTTPTCGAVWSADTGNSTPPPAGPLPAFMAVIVTSSATQSGSTVSGNTVHIVIVQTNPGYAPDPGHAGTGKVVATVC